MFNNVRMVFAGDPVRGKRFNEAAGAQGWRLQMAEGPEQAIALCVEYEADLVIIDDFPESEEARSLFYRLRTAGMGPFLLLSDAPEEMRFSGLGALSFLRMIKRDPQPAELINAVIRLIESNRGSRSRRVAPSSSVKKEPISTTAPAHLPIQS